MRELRLVLLGIVAVFALLLGGAFVYRAFKGPTPATVATVPDEAPPAAETRPSVPPEVRAARASIERSIADAPDYARFFDRLRLVFPSEYESIMDGLAVASLQRKDLSADMVMADAVVALRKAHGALAAKASDDALSQIFTLQLTETRELEKRDPHLCVAFLNGASGQGFISFAADHRALVADAAIAGLQAMYSGRTDQVQRGPPVDSDFQALDRALVDKGLTRPQIDALLDGKPADPPIADDIMCKAGQSYLETLATLPPDVRARLYGLAVDLMAKS